MSRVIKLYLHCLILDLITGTQLLWGSTNLTFLEYFSLNIISANILQNPNVMIWFNTAINVIHIIYDINVDSFKLLFKNISWLKIHTLIVIHFSAHLRTYFSCLVICFMSKNKSKMYEHINLLARRDQFFIFTTLFRYVFNSCKA